MQPSPVHPLRQAARGPAPPAASVLQSPEGLKAQVGRRAHADRKVNDPILPPSRPPEPCPPPAPHGCRNQHSRDSSTSEARARAEAQGQARPRKLGLCAGLNRRSTASKLSLGLTRGSAQVLYSRDHQQDK
ncbi:hypothetical protein NDU88_011698 [Pleurodeles waltl]|uniref:Uncharacterized protein n=1 Tax=Pleurodeles waltl TaxID=8319 RepID=A0AAV7PZ24_PLEWA|nr:hypothetical protein NDU88_011698 [Pleurodeles waltl]